MGYSSPEIEWGVHPIAKTIYLWKIVSMNAKEEISNDISNGLSGFQKRITETARNVGSATDKYVNEHAWTSVAVAAMLGCVVGFFLGRRRD